MPSSPVVPVCVEASAGGAAAPPPRGPRPPGPMPSVPVIASTFAPAMGLPVVASVTVPAIAPPRARVKSRVASTSIGIELASNRGARPFAETPKRYEVPRFNVSIT